MNTLPRLTVMVLATLPFSSHASSDDWLDRLGDKLTWSTDTGTLRAHASGTLDLTGYWFEQPAPALLHADGNSLVTPSLQAFLDVQAGSRVYLFAQARVDRGFDPGEDEWHARVDEYALRIALRGDGALNVQAGKFATVVGNWVPRHHLWQNPFLNAPLPYENVTALWDASTPASVATLLNWANLGPIARPADPYPARLQVPVIWGPSYASGAALSGSIDRFDYAIEMKNASLSSRPENWNVDDTGGEHPTFSGRVGYRPDLAWNVGVSASAGSYLAPHTPVPPGFDANDYRQITYAADASYAWHHWQVWAEVFATRFEIPRIGSAETFAYYVEVRRKFGPHFSAALRWNQQTYGSVPDNQGGETKWGRDTSRIDIAPSYRFTAHLLLKLQYSVQQHPFDGRDHAHTLGAQIILRF
jgi:hypothetical protein